MGRKLDSFFEPRSVAVIGATSVRHKSGNDILLNITANGYTGELYLVNPKGGEIMGKKVYGSIGDLPEGIDLAVIILPAKLNPQAIRECAARGIRAIVLAAGGFSEVDEEGRLLQAELEKVVQETGVRVIGPNTSGTDVHPVQFYIELFPAGQGPPGSYFLHRPDGELRHPHHALYRHGRTLRRGARGRHRQQDRRR